MSYGNLLEIYKSLIWFSSEAARKEYEALSKYADLIEPKANNRADFIKEAKSGALDGTLAIYRTFASASITGRVDEELVGSLPKSVKFICHNGKSRGEGPLEYSSKPREGTKGNRLSTTPCFYTSLS